MLFGVKISLGRKKVKLDDKQLEQIEAMCRTASIEYVKIKLADTRKLMLRRQELSAKVIMKVLTPEQREQMKKRVPKKNVEPTPGATSG